MGTSTAVQRDEVQEVIQTKSGKVTGAFRSIARGSILISHIDNDACPRGAICMTNRESGRRSTTKTGHVVFAGGLYDLLRGLKHIARGSALWRGEFYTRDIRYIERVIDEARARSSALLYLEFLSDDEHQMMEREFDLRVKGLQRGRNVHKVEALMHFSNSRKLHDRTGRRNVGAAAMRNGAGVGRLIDRKREIMSIIDRIDKRIPYVVNEIADAMQPFHRLRELTTPVSVIDPQRTVVPEERFEALLVEGRRRGLERVEDQLRECVELLDPIDVRPFYEHAQVIRREALAMATACADGLRQDARAHLKVIRELLTPVFAKHTLETALIAPLSYLLEEVSSRQKSGEMRESFFAPRFKRIEQTLLKFYGQLKSCSDEHLPVRYLGAVRTIVGHALAEAKAGGWDHCKNLLKDASKHLS